jgi:hypothetical protein
LHEDLGESEGLNHIYKMFKKNRYAKSKDKRILLTPYSQESLSALMISNE